MNAFDQGYDHYNHGGTTTDNPYAKDSIEYGQWVSGYYQAQDDDYEYYDDSYDYDQFHDGDDGYWNNY